MNQLTPEIAEEFQAIMQRKGLRAAYQYLESLHIKHKAMDFIIADDGQRLEAKRDALKVAPHIHASLLRQLGKDTLERAYDTGLTELQRAATPAPAASDAGATAGDRNIGKSARLDPVFGVAVKAMSGRDQIELTHRRAESLGLSPYLISGLSKALGEAWPNVLDQLQYAFAGVKLKTP